MSSLKNDVRWWCGSIRLFLAALALMWVVRLGLWFVSFQSVSAFCQRLRKNDLRSNQPRVQGDSLPTQRQVLRAVTRASRAVHDPTCLVRALAGWALLGRHGFAGELIIGVSKLPEGRLEAHAWIQDDDQILIGAIADIGRFERLPSISFPDL